MGINWKKPVLIFVVSVIVIVLSCLFYYTRIFVNTKKEKTDIVYHDSGNEKPTEENTIENKNITRKSKLHNKPPKKDEQSSVVDGSDSENKEFYDALTSEELKTTPKKTRDTNLRSSTKTPNDNEQNSVVDGYDSENKEFYDALTSEESETTPKETRDTNLRSSTKPPNDNEQSSVNNTSTLNNLEETKKSAQESSWSPYELLCGGSNLIYDLYDEGFLFNGVKRSTADKENNDLIQKINQLLSNIEQYWNFSEDYKETSYENTKEEIKTKFDYEIKEI